MRELYYMVGIKVRRVGRVIQYKYPKFDYYRRWFWYDARDSYVY